MSAHNRNRKPAEKRWPEEDLRLAYGLLRADPLFHRIPMEVAPDLVKLALGAGVFRAERVLEAHGVPDPMKLARKSDVRIIFDITYRNSRALRILSSYAVSPPTITIYENSLQDCRARLALDPRFSSDYLLKLTNICVAHELYHHYEHENFDFAHFSYKVTVADFRIFKIQRTLGALSEIAANSFAKKLMNLSRLPCVIHGAFMNSGTGTEGGDDR